MCIVAISAVICVYSITSFVLRLYPHLLHSQEIKRRKSKLVVPHGDLHHISHRGGAAENLENTMKAFDHAYQLGTDIFEIDCHMTKDGHAVVVHDSHLLRLCGEDIYVEDTDFADLPPLLCTQRLDFDHNIQITKIIPEKDRKIPLLEELFEKYPQMPMNIDIKVNDIRLIKVVEQLVIKHGRVHLTIWGTSSHSVSKNIRAANEQIAAIFSLTEVATTVILYYLGLLPFVPLHADYFEIPLFSLLLERMESFPEKTKTVLRRLLITTVDYLVINERFIEHLKKRAVPTYIFVLNTEDEWKRAKDCGASGIMTDFPTKLKHWMNEK